MSGDNKQLVSCPRCGSPSTELITIEAGMRGIIQESKIEGADNLPNEVCKTCYNSLTSLVSKGARLRIEQQAREKNKHMLWKSRVNLVKQARQYMTQKDYSEAAVTYEKYIRVLEIAYDLKPGQLSPEVFGKSSKSKELTVIATCYWDLLRIYDTAPTYRDRMLRAADKLAEFLPFSPIFPDVIKKAQQFASSSKNPDIVRRFLSAVKANNPRCFIVTASYYPEHEMVHFFRQYRDEVLQKSVFGRSIIRTYYFVAPGVAKIIENNELFKSTSRHFLSFIQRRLRTPKFTKSWPSLLQYIGT